MSDFVIQQGTSAGPLPQAEPLMVYTAADDMFRDCPVLTKTRALSIPKDICATIEWTFRNRAGEVVNLVSIIPDTAGAWGASATTTTPEPSGQVIFRFKEVLCNSNTVHQVVGWGYDVENGKVRARLPASLMSEANLYRMEVAVTNQYVDGEVQAVDTGILSVERSLFTSVTQLDSFRGPLTLGELRLYLRDTAIENDLLDDVEYSEAEILYAIVRPIQEWNETPPTVAIYQARDFPFRYFWTKATIAELMKTAAHWYRRNKLQASHGGISVDDKNKDREYLLVAQQLRAEWLEWMKNKKLEINLGLASGSMGSIYGGYGW